MATDDEEASTIDDPAQAKRVARQAQLLDSQKADTPGPRPPRIVKQAKKDQTPPDNGGFGLPQLLADKRARDKRRLEIERGAELTEAEVEARKFKFRGPQPEGFDRQNADLTTAPEARHPGERPVQPVGSTHDASGRQFHGPKPDAAAAVVWQPNTEVKTDAASDPSKAFG